MWRKHSLVNGSLISLGRYIWLRFVTNSLLYKEKHSPAHVTPHKKDQRCPEASWWVSSCTNNSSWKMQQETQPVPSSCAGSRAASSAAPSSSPLLITGKEFALWQIKSFTQPLARSHKAARLWQQLHLRSSVWVPRTCKRYMTSRLLQSLCHTCCCSEVTAPSEPPGRLFKHSYTGHLASHFSTIWGASDRTTWFISQTPIPGTSAAQQVPGGTARTLKNRLCADEPLLCFQGRITSSLPPQLKGAYCLDMQLQQSSVWHSRERFQEGRHLSLQNQLKEKKWIQSFLPLKMCLLD